MKTWYHFAITRASGTGQEYSDGTFSVPLELEMTESFFQEVREAVAKTANWKVGEFVILSLTKIS